jgi:neutral ceramidase
MPLHARALAIGAGEARTFVLVIAEVCGITAEISDAVAAALRASHGLDRAQVAVTVTHTHTGPAIRGLLPFSFGRDLPADQAERVARYTDVLQRKLIEAARTALADRRPARLAWGEGRASFAVQRRRIENGRWVGFGEVAGGPVDHALPVLRVTDERGGLRAVFTSYACHCTSLGGLNVIHPDWAGEAAARIEEERPGTVALVGIGCGADAGPVPRGSRDAAAENGEAIMREVTRVLGARMPEVPAPAEARFRTVSLPLDRAVPRTELEERAKGKVRLDAHAARELLRELDAGRQPRTAVPYPVQVWTFGDTFAMVFLGGEVVSGYALRLRRELPGRGLWVNAYANDQSCYIPSRPMYSEGGYEVDGSIGKYGWPTRLAAGTEDLIIAAVHDLMPASLRRAASAAER